MVFEEERGNDMDSIINVLKAKSETKKGNLLSYYYTPKWVME